MNCVSDRLVVRVPAKVTGVDLTKEIYKRDQNALGIWAAVAMCRSGEFAGTGSVEVVFNVRLVFTDLMPFPLKDWMSLRSFGRQHDLKDIEPIAAPLFYLQYVPVVFTRFKLDAIVACHKPIRTNVGLDWSSVLGMERCSSGNGGVRYAFHVWDGKDEHVPVLPKKSAIMFFEGK